MEAQTPTCKLPKGFQNLARIGVWLYKHYLSTLRVSWFNENGTPFLDDLPKGVILAGWHHHQLLVPGLLGPKGVYFLVSRSMGAELLKMAAKVFGSRFVQGVRGLDGLKATVRLLRILQEGHTIALAPDGPLGPRFYAKPGAAYLAIRLGVPIIPVAMATSLRTLNPFSWDRYWIPLPFSRVVVVIGEPLWPSKTNKNLKPSVEPLRASMQNTLDTLDCKAYGFLKGTSPTKAF
jgi:lysophospholipid acyltransferase (LPLAT)-like uncharacterized protein